MKAFRLHHVPLLYFWRAAAVSTTPPRVASPLLALEHVNLNVPSWTPPLQKFWFDALGFARDPRAEEVYERVAADGGSMQGLVWANIGLQQVHMPVGEPEESTQQVRGVVGLAFDDLPALRQRLQQHSIDFEEETDVEANAEFGPGLRFNSPTGVAIRAHGKSEFLGPPEAAAAGVMLPGGSSIGHGMPYVELFCATGAAAGICRFYQDILGVPVRKAAKSCSIAIGSQSLVFREKAQKLPPYDGHHVAVYVGNISTGDTRQSFTAMYERCKAAGLIYNNPRFPGLRYDTLEDAVRLGEFRILDLVDPQDGSAAYRLEHEIRSLEHPGFSCKALLPQRTDEL